MSRVLVIDDDQALLRALRVGLSARGHEVIVAITGEEGLSKIALDEPDVVLLDLGLPDLDGLEVCHRIRQWSDVPVIVVSAAGQENRKVAALDGGANDYVTKPFGVVELEARIRRAIRDHRAARVPQGDHRLVVGGLELDLVHHQATFNGEEIRLTAKEFDLLA